MLPATALSTEDPQGGGASTHLPATSRYEYPLEFGSLGFQFPSMCSFQVTPLTFHVFTTCGVHAPQATQTIDWLELPGRLASLMLLE